MEELPILPEIKDKREAKVTPKVEAWFMKNYPFDCLVEVKATKTNTVPPSAVKPHQLSALKAVRSAKGLVHKLSDAGHVRNPADFWMMRKAQSFVVACFLNDGICLAIHPDKWQGARIDTPCEFRIYL